MMVTWDDVRDLALRLPETSEETSRGTRVWKVSGKSFLWERPLRPGDLLALGDSAPTGPILGVRTSDLGFKEALIASEGAAFTTPHFDGYCAVLIDLSAISSAHLKPIIVEAWLARAPKRIAAAYLQEHPGRTGA